MNVVRCRRCKRKLVHPEYVARGSGRVCGGPITHPRQPSAVRAAVGRQRVEEMPGQLELDLEEVSG